MKITDLIHPDYNTNIVNWQKWRDTYNGGSNFINRYLQQYSKRETTEDFESRKALTPCPNFAGALVDEVKNSIYERMSEIKRVGGSDIYQKTIAGLNSGVDLLGSSMNRFIGQQVLIELLIMRQVGVYVDMPNTIPNFITENNDIHPYLYYYKVEDIMNWEYCEGGSEFSKILLKDTIKVTDPETGLCNGYKCVYRLLWINELGTVSVQYYSEQKVEGTDNEYNLIPDGDVIILNINKIPFYMASISKSLLENLCEYQMALLNMESSDINYAIRANFPFYVENYDPASENSYAKQQSGEGNEKEIKVGAVTGRRFAKGLIAPEFIHPSPEPLKVSMEKEEKLKNDMRQILGLTLSTMQPRYSSAESKGMDAKSLEAGLSYIGLELAHAENRIATFWAMYESGKPAEITYPEKYSIKTIDERKAEAQELIETIKTVPSNTARKEALKQLIECIFNGRVPRSVVEIMKKEVDVANYIDSDPETIAKDLENGLVTTELASEARGYPKGEADKAKKEHQERLREIQKAQTSPNDQKGPTQGLKDTQPINDGKVDAQLQGK